MFLCKNVDKVEGGTYTLKDLSSYQLIITYRGN